MIRAMAAQAEARPWQGPAETPYRDEVAVLATMHGKERVIAPLLERALGLRIRVAPIDTDRFGTFSHEIERTGTQLDAARAKIAAAFEAAPDASVALASEGSFSPHPSLFFVPLNREIVVFHDRAEGLELIGHHASMNTNFSHAVVSSVVEARAFAERAKFPGHGLIVLGCRDGRPAPGLGLIKDVRGAVDLARAVERIVRRHGTAIVETDMRAHRNPTRLRAIKRATLDLIRRYRSRCPACVAPGFALTERLAGLPCGWCGGPTLAIKAEVMTCAACGHRVERPAGDARADPGHCPDCNP